VKLIYLLISFIIIISALLIFISQTSPANNSPVLVTETALINRIPETHRIDLRVGTIDTRKTDPYFKSIKSKTGGQGLYIIQFNQKVLPELKKETADLGVNIISYFPQNGLLIQSDYRNLLRVSELKYIQWVGYYYPVYKYINNDFSSIKSDLLPFPIMAVFL